MKARKTKLKVSNLVIEIKVIAKASRNAVKEEDGRFKVYVTKAPERGKANQAVIDLLAKHFKVSKSCVTIIQGETSSRKKIVIIR